MNKQYENFKLAVAAVERPVILLAGSRKVPENQREKLVALAAWLSREFPSALFRSGNADGSDALFARGINSVDPARLQLVVPTAGHRKSNRHSCNSVFPLGTVSAAVESELARWSNEATPENKRIIDKRDEIPQLKSKARYLLRDTLMARGDQGIGLAPATVGVFYTSSDPMSGGTGHTIRCCEKAGIPAFIASNWWRWID